MARGIFAALEEEELVIEDNNEVEQLEADVELAELNEDQIEIDGDSGTIEDALDDVAELEGISEVMEKSIEKEEGLDEDAAAMAQIATEAICLRLGYTPKKPIIPALESFGGSSSRLSVTKIALEETSETIRKAWEAIKSFFRNIWENIKDFLARLFDANVKLGERVKKLEANLDVAVTNSFVIKEGKGKININKFAKMFNTTTPGKLVDNISDILGNHIAATKEVGVVNDKISNVVAAGLKASEQVSDAVGGGWGELVKGLSGLTKKTYFGGVTVSVSQDGLITFVPSKATAATGEVEVRKLSSLKGVIENVSDLQKMITSSKDSYEKAGTTVKNILSEMNKLSDKESGDKVTNSIKKLKVIQKVLVFANTKMPSLSIKAANGALNFVNANLNSYGASAK